MPTSSGSAVRRASVARTRASHHAARLHQIGTIVEVGRDTGPSTFTWTESAPWQLGHGAWVIKLAGVKGGGFDCGRVVPISCDLTEWTHVEFEDQGQDLIGVYIHKDNIEWVELPSLGDVFGGCKVLNGAPKVGGFLEIKSRFDDRKQLRYRIERVSKVLKRDVVRAAVARLMKPEVPA